MSATIKRLFVVAAVIGFIGRGLWFRLKGSEVTPPVALNFQIHEEAADHGLKFNQKPIGSEYLTHADAKIHPWIQLIGASVAVSDVNEDGFMDVLALHNQAGYLPALFINDGHGNFEDKSQDFGWRGYTVSNVPQRAVFFDCDNDGHKDLFLIGYSCPIIMHREKDGFRAIEDAGFSAPCSFTHAVALADIDNDGATDILTGGFHENAMDAIPESLVDSQNGSVATIWKNDGNCHFRPDKKEFESGGRQFHHSIGLGDLRGLGRVDVWMANDFSGDQYFLRDKKGHFFKGERPRTHSANGMNSEVFYLNAGEPPFIYVSHIFKPEYMASGNTLWHYEDGRFRERSLELGLNRCGWSWGSRALDLDNDGDLDLATVNGGIRGDLNKDVWYSFTSTMLAFKSVASNARFWPDLRGRDMSGHEQDCLFLNQGGHFVNVAEQVGFDQEKLSGKAVAVIDAENNGQQNLIVGNQNGRLYYYRVQPSPENSWIGFELESLNGARDALGAVVTVKASGKSWRRELFTTNTFSSQSDPRLHFGLGAVRKLDSVEVRWPSGQVQSLGPFELNHYYRIIETRN